MTERGDNINELLLKSSIHYYCLNKMYRTMASSALEGIRMYLGEQLYRFYYGISLAFEGRVQEAIRELDQCQSDRDLSIAAYLALIYAHRKCQVIDKETVAKLESKVRENRKHANDMSLYFAGLFLLLSGRLEKSKEYIDRMIKMSPNFKEGLILKGWLGVLSGNNTEITQMNHSAMSYFDVSSKSNDPEVILGKSKVLEKNGSFMAGIEQLNQAIVLYPRFLPAYVEKMKLQACLKDWEQVVDTAFRALAIDKHCLDAQRFIILHSLAWDNNDDQGSSKLLNLIQSFEIREPKNAELYYETAKLFARIAFRDEDVLIHTMTLIERAVFLDPTNIVYVCEHAFQCMLLNRMSDAQRHYKSATKLDENSIVGLIGLLHCQLIEEQTGVEDQLESLEEFNKATGMSKELLYLCALSGQRRNKSSEQILKYLDQIVEQQNSTMKGLPLGIEYYIKLDPDLMMNVTKLYLLFSPNEPIIAGQPLPSALKQAKNILQPLVNACPIQKEPLYLMAKVNYLSGDTQAAISLLQKCLDQNTAFSDGHLLMAQILLHLGNIQTSSKSLEMALSHNFQIREQIHYILTKALVLKTERKYEEALKLLKSGLKRKSLLSQNDKISLYLQMVDIYSLTDQTTEASKLLAEMLESCRDTPDEGRIMIANAQLAEARGDIDAALSLLREIRVDHGDHFVRSRELMAIIYLKHRKDRRLYAGCYREILDKKPTTQSFLMLGDAYMNILEPERAIEIYEQALKKNPKDWILTRKVGQALIKTHFYEKAVTYYKAAIKTSGQNAFRYDLAHLLYRLKKYSESQIIITSALEISQTQDLQSLEWEVKLIHLLGQVQLNTDNKGTAIATLKRAHQTNQKLMRRLPVEQPDQLAEQRKFSISLCKQLGELISTHLRDTKQALIIYKEALNYDEANADILMLMAKLEAMNQNYEIAHNYCVAILKHAPHLDEPVLMMADLTFRQNDFEGALNHFNELLSRKPTYYPAMNKLIETAKRVGQLDIVPAVLERAEKYSPRTVLDSGYHYAKGLYNWYTGDNNEAMKSFNKARQDPDIGVEVTYHMIDICINPDNETIGGETFDTMVQLSPGERDSYQNAALKTADQLLSDIRSKVIDDLDFHIICNFVLLAKRQKSEADLALNEFLKILNDDRYRDNVAAILGVSTAFMILKQTPKARNQLKRLAKNNWNYQEAEYLEKCWLLLADIYTQSAKYDKAIELMKKVLLYNKSCMKAYEYLGYIMEREQSFKDAAHNYELAWKFTNCNNPNIGYKLAFNFMKAKRYVDAIDVCKVILQKYPDYPKIRKEILDKCRNSLKT
ncbi:tetratricopeptide repeat protein 21B-like [Oppia nitens]|uniref:tetratricopeptide repeat protein 21B-like n=1 Tax=Oppia nitens TaxID=1686743 RepID=UPI0023DBF7CA|nr:tetratricopeptide repeat protein 21B-like [Oppia nitens]